DAVPEILGPRLDPGPHPPEVLLRDLAEEPLGLLRGHLLRRVVQDEDPGDEPVLELLVHGALPLSRETRRLPERADGRDDLGAQYPGGAPATVDAPHGGAAKITTGVCIRT